MRVIASGAKQSIGIQMWAASSFPFLAMTIFIIERNALPSFICLKRALQFCNTRKLNVTKMQKSR